MATPMDQLFHGLGGHINVDQNVVAALVVSIVLRKPVLLNLVDNKTPIFGILGNKIQTAVQEIGMQLLECQDPKVVQCHMDMTWNQLVDQMVDKQTESIPQIVFINCIDHAPTRVQALLLSSINDKRITSGQDLGYAFPDFFLLVAANTGNGRLLEHLKDGFLMSYDVSKNSFTGEFMSVAVDSHDGSSGRERDSGFSKPENQPVNDVLLASEQPATNNDNEDIDTGSVLGPASSLTSTANKPGNNLQTLAFIREHVPLVTITADIRRYMENIVVFLRSHRLIRKGVSPKAVKDFENLVRVLCVLHEYTFATPTLVALTARIVFPLKLTLCQPEQEPTIVYGGDVNLIRQWMGKWDVDLVIEDVLSRVPPPM